MQVSSSPRPLRPPPLLPFVLLPFPLRLPPSYQRSPSPWPRPPRLGTLTLEPRPEVGERWKEGGLLRRLRARAGPPRRLPQVLVRAITDLSHYVYLDGSKVSLVQIPSKEELRHKNLSSVSGCKMYWQNNGEYLAIQVDLYANTTNNNCTGFELFRIKERDIPVEVFELDNKDENIVAFEWEPRGHRFAIIHGDGTRHDISFYSMCTADNVSLVSKLITLEAKQANALFWSPAGQFVVLAELKGFNGQLEFLNVDDLETMAREEHFMATHIMWDPTGRFVATAVTSVDETENGFQIWSFAGKQIYKVSKEQFYQFQWRPRPPSMLTPEEAEIST